jgi:8-oxo-dGTP pyrophosphatase MutT (NUDIX family)
MNDIKNPWTTLSSKVVYDNPWVTLKHEEVITPGGNPGIYGIAHFKNKAIGIVPLDTELNTYLVGQYRYPLNEYSWEIPMGGGPLDVDILDSAQRELLEETGLKAQEWTNIGRIHTSNSVTDEEGFIFLAENLSQHAAQPEDTEQLKVMKVSFAEAIRMVMDNEITDSLSVYGILKVARLKGL